MSALDLAAMLRFLFDNGWKPALLAESVNFDRGAAARWVCYPQGEVRAYEAFRDPDPVNAVRLLYEHALKFPNAVPTFPPSISSALDQRDAICERECADYRASRGCRCVERGLREPKPAPMPFYEGVVSYGGPVGA